MLRLSSSMHSEKHMQGVHAFDPSAKTAIHLESFVSQDHFLRRVDRELELSFVRELTACCRQTSSKVARIASVPITVIGLLSPVCSIAVASPVATIREALSCNVVDMLFSLCW